MDIQKILYVFRAIGIVGIARTIKNSIYHTLIDKRFNKKPIDDKLLYPGDCNGIIPIESGILVDFDNIKLEIIFLSAALVRITWKSGKESFPYTIDKQDWEPQQIIQQVKNNNLSITCRNFEVIINNIGAIQVQNLDGGILHSTEPPVLKSETWHLKYHLQADEHLYGLGERAASLNLRPGNYRSWNKDASGSYTSGTDPLYIGTPIILSMHDKVSSLVYFENTYDSKYLIDQNLSIFFKGGQLRYYVFGGSLEQIYGQLSDLIGHPNMPPRWTLGYHQCRWGYKNDADIRNVVAGFEKHHLPLSSIHLDIDYMDGFRVFTINKNRFPNLKKLATELLQKNIHLVTTINPAVRVDKKYSVYRDGLDRNAFCKLPNGKIYTGVSWPGKVVFPDFSHPEVRSWWAELYDSLIKEGISGFWHDMNEPSSFTAWGDLTIPECTQHNIDGIGGNHREVHNIYALLMNKSAYAGILTSSPGKRPWIFSRSGWTGLQKYAWNWTGDIESTWEALSQTIRTILGLSLSGHYFSGCDIGGFSGNPSAELYTRWFQMAAFFPLFRTHSAIGKKPREPWVFGEPYTSIIKNFLEIRYRLLPYFYTLVWSTVQTGIPFIRPVFWSYPGNAKLWDLDDEFLVGESLLIAPFTKKGVDSREITFPEGIWYSFWEDEFFIGPITIRYTQSIEKLPIFAKGGCYIPMETGETLYLHIYPIDEGTTMGTIYLDEGDGFGDYRVDRLLIDYGTNSMTVNWKTEGDYPFPYQNIIVILHHKKIKRAKSEGKELAIDKNTVNLERPGSLQLFF